MCIDTVAQNCLTSSANSRFGPQFSSTPLLNDRFCLASGEVAHQGFYCSIRYEWQVSVMQCSTKLMYALALSQYERFSITEMPTITILA